MKLLLILFLSLSLPSKAQDLLPASGKLINGFDPRRDIISADYIAGEFLIYDCLNKHWVCVMEEYFTKCEEQRVEDSAAGKTFARCAPLKKFPVKFSCYQQQLRLVSNVDATKLCILDKWKAKHISFD